MEEKLDLNIKKSNVTKAEINCKNCGTHLKFKPGLEALVCSNCKTENKIVINSTQIVENDYLNAINRIEKTASHQEVHTVNCNSCGGGTTLKQNEVSASCPYCGGSLIVSQKDTHSAIKPDYLLPFKIENEKALSLFSTWINDLWWAPNELKKKAKQSEKLVGVYYPYWTYDTRTISEYTGQRGDDYTTTETYETTDEDGDTETETVIETDWTYVSGTVTKYFNDILVVASDSLPRKYVRELEPWDLENLQEYNDKFLPGFRAETHFVSITDGFEIAKGHMDEGIRSKVDSDIGGDHQRIATLNVAYDDIKFKHILLPIWISAYKYNNKVYRFVINGRTGEVQGERPYSEIKITLAVLFGISVIAGIWYAIAQN